MAVGNDVPLTAKLEVPDWLWNGHPERFLAEAGLRVRSERGRHLLVQTYERYQRTSPDLVRPMTVAGGGTRPRFELLAAVDPYAGNNTDFRAGVADTARRAEQSHNIVDLFYHWQLRTMTARRDELPAVAEQIFDAIRALPLDGDPPVRIFDPASVHAVTRASELVHRVSVPALWLRINFDPQLAAGDVSHIRAANEAGEAVFASAQNLRDGVYVFDAYIAPLIGALTPLIWAIPAITGETTVIYALGHPVAGTSGHATELLHLLPIPGASTSVKVPQLTPDASRLALDWWASALNSMFGVLTDLAVFTDATATYAPTKHLNALLTVEQLFRRVASIQAAHRDTNARRVLLFTVLDTLERLTGRDIATLCSLRFAQRTYNSLSETLPHPAAEVLLPAAARAVSALEEVQRGFFLSPSSVGRLRITYPDGVSEDLALESAAAQYIRVLRNATHGHGSNRPDRTKRTEALLASHDGTVSHDLGLLGYLYLLDLLSKPSALRQKLFHSGGI